MDDRTLIEQYAQDGSESAFAMLTERHEGFVFATAFRHVRDADLAQDVMQNVFLCVARKAAALTSEPVFRGWLGRTTHFEALKLLRERRRRAQREQLFHADENHEKADAADGSPEALEAVQTGLRRLPERDRRALLLRFAEGMTLKAAADALEISEDAAQKRISRALEKLRRLVKPSGIPAAGLTALLGAPALSTGCPVVAGVTGGTSLLASITSLAVMTKLKIVALTTIAAALTATPFIIHALREEAPKAPATFEKNVELPVERRHGDVINPSAENPRRAVVRKDPPSAELQPSQALESDPLKAARARALNPRNDPRDRMMAVRELRERNGRDPQVAAAMAALARTDIEPAIRADIFRQLHGVKEPSLRQALVEALQTDASDEVRQEAAETLSDYSDNPAIAALLSATIRKDVDGEVREAAAESLVQNASADTLLRIQADPEATDLELYHTTGALRKHQGTTEAQAALLLNVLKASGVPDLRKEIVEDLGKHYAKFPGVTEWMEHLASTEQDPRVRKEAARFSPKTLK